jgi:hypothetical protein
VPSALVKLRNAAAVRVDVVQLVDDRVELRHPGLTARIEQLLARPGEHLIAESWQGERNQIADPRAVDVDERRLGDEPFRTMRDPAGASIAPEEMSRLARRQRQAVAGRERPLGAGSAEPPEHQHLVKVDKREGLDARDDVAHEPGDALGVVNHAFVRPTLTPPGAPAPRCIGRNCEIL